MFPRSTGTRGFVMVSAKQVTVACLELAHLSAKRDTMFVKMKRCGTKFNFLLISYGAFSFDQSKGMSSTSCIMLLLINKLYRYLH